MLPNLSVSTLLLYLCFPPGQRLPRQREMLLYLCFLAALCFIRFPLQETHDRDINLSGLGRFLCCMHCPNYSQHAHACAWKRFLHLKKYAELCRIDLQHQGQSPLIELLALIRNNFITGAAAKENDRMVPSADMHVQQA